MDRVCEVSMSLELLRWQWIRTADEVVRACRVVIPIDCVAIGAVPRFADPAPFGQDAVNDAGPVRGNLLGVPVAVGKRFDGHGV